MSRRYQEPSHAPTISRDDPRAGATTRGHERKRVTQAHLGMLLWALFVGLSFPAVGLLSDGLPPLLLTAMRFSFALSWKLVVVVEAIGQPNGIGSACTNPARTRCRRAVE